MQKEPPTCRREFFRVFVDRSAFYSGRTLRFLAENYAFAASLKTPRLVVRRAAPSSEELDGLSSKEPPKGPSYAHEESYRATA